MTQTLPASPSVACPIPTFHVGDDSVILLGSTALVSSKSAPDAWWEVDAALHLCPCPGFTYRRHCRHIDAVRQAEEQDRESNILPFPEPPARTTLGATIWCADCGCDKAEIGVRCHHCHDVYWGTQVTRPAANGVSCRWCERPASRRGLCDSHARADALLR